MYRILISNPSSMYLPFLPYLHGVLKQYAQTNATVRENFEWLKPVYLYGTPEELLKEYDLSSIDVLGLSCYVWNFSLQNEMARMVKAKNPKCLVVAGGPEPDWNDPNFFNKFPWIDIVVTHDGEVPFQKILLEKLKGPKADYSKIPGTISLINEKWHRNFELERPEWSHMSPYCDDDQMLEILNSHPPHIETAVIWETNRGCPYACVFCDWGSNVNTKIRVFPEDKIVKEIKWFSDHKIHRVYITDANFGILSRDEEIIDKICTSKYETGWPQIVDWCAAKNNIERVTDICLKLNQAKLNRGVLIGYQSTNAEVLSSMVRMNMSELRHRQMVEKLKAKRVHIFAAIILGSPDDTCESFQQTIHDLLDLGFHDSIRCYLYAVLPNAPANSPEYLQRHKIATKRSKIVGPVRRNSDLDDPYYPKIDYIVAHNKMDKNDWIANCLYYGFISAVHNLGLLRYVSLFFKFHHEVEYKDFYPSLFDHFLHRPETILGKALGEVKVWLEEFFRDPEKSFFIRNDEEDLLYEHEKWIFIRCNEQIDFFFSEIEDYLSHKYRLDFLLEDLIAFQKFSIVPMSGTVADSQIFNNDWKEFFETMKAPLSSVPCEICIDVGLAGKSLCPSNVRSKRVGYSHYVLGSMIYKNSLSLIGTNRMKIKVVETQS